VFLVKLTLELGFGFQGIVPFPEVGVILTAGVFLIGFLLAGTMADYKESERLPGEISSTLETLEEICVLAATMRPETIKLPALRREILDLTESIYDWLHQRKTTPEVYAALSAAAGTIQRLEQGGAGPYASRAIPQLLMIRRSVVRIDVIARTGFLPPAYALLEVLIFLVIGIMMLAQFRSGMGFVIVPLVTLVNVYMLRLIRDIDNPFDYGQDGKSIGAAEVDLFPIAEYRDRLLARVDEELPVVPGRPVLQSVDTGDSAA
jgi:hypothetical protein